MSNEKDREAIEKGVQSAFKEWIKYGVYSPFPAETIQTAVTRGVKNFLDENRNAIIEAIAKEVAAQAKKITE